METFEKLIPPLERAVAALDKLDPMEAEKRLERHQVKLVGSIVQNLDWLAGSIIDLGKVGDLDGCRCLGNFQGVGG